MDQLSAALLRLNLETREYHDAADEGWSFLRHARIRRRDYIDQLIVTYGFESSVESALAYTPNLRSLIDLRQRARAGLIAQDLIASGLTPIEVSILPQYNRATPFDSIIEALGWLYVLERPTLTFDALRRWIVRALGPQTPTAYLRAYEGDAGAHWSTLGHLLDEVCTDEHAIEELVTAARGGFQAVISWDKQVRAQVQGRNAL